MFWSREEDSIQQTFELTESKRTTDAWLKAVLRADRIGAETWEMYCFIHGLPTRNPGSWDLDTNAITCGQQRLRPRFSGRLSLLVHPQPPLHRDCSQHHSVQGFCRECGWPFPSLSSSLPLPRKARLEAHCSSVAAWTVSLPRRDIRWTWVWLRTPRFISVGTKKGRDRGSSQDRDGRK